MGFPNNRLLVWIGFISSKFFWLNAERGCNSRLADRSNYTLTVDISRFCPHSMNPRRGFQPRRPWNIPTSGSLAWEFTHCPRVSALSHAQTHLSKASDSVLLFSSSLLPFAVNWSSPLCCRYFDIHVKRSAAPEGPGLQELLVPRVRWAGMPSRSVNKERNSHFIPILRSSMKVYA